MAKRILTLCLALVIGIAFAMPAVAAVNTIKVGGDLTIRGIYRQNLDFQGNNFYGNDEESWLMSEIRIWVSADLTDNVSAVVRLLNERDWGNENETVLTNNVDLDLAYVKIKDLFVPGFSATIGRQEILLGKGFVVGNVNGLSGYPFNLASLRAGDLTARKAFDAVRLDYEVGTTPVTITLFDAKISETAPNNEDGDLYGLNVAYKTDNLNLAGYALLFNQQTGGDNDMYTFGARIDHNVFPGLNYNLEGFIQTGDSWGGWAGNGDVSYTFQSPMELKVGGAWYYASGDDDAFTLYPDNLSDRIGRITYANIINLGAGFITTNLSVPKVYASFKPSEKQTLSLAWFPASTIVETNGDNDLGWGLNSGLTYQYTEDVSFGVCVDYARAGDAISPNNDSNDAWQAIGTVAVTF